VNWVVGPVFGCIPLRIWNRNALGKSLEGNQRPGTCLDIEVSKARIETNG
jgi:hypothetical protein